MIILSTMILMDFHTFQWSWVNLGSWVGFTLGGILVGNRFKVPAELPLASPLHLGPFHLDNTNNDLGGFTK